MNRYDIGRRIEAYREKRKMSTQELAERIRRSQATISRIENGKQGLTFELLTRIADVLRVHPFALLSDEPPRTPVLIPPQETREAAVAAPGLLANALHAGRLRRRLRIGAAAALLGMDEPALEAVELAQQCPGEALLERICDLYGLPSAEMRLLKQFDTARSLASLQDLFSRVHRLIESCGEGGEERILGQIHRLIDSAEGNFGGLPEDAGDEVGLFLNRLSLHLVNALKDGDFLERQMFLLQGKKQTNFHSG